MVYTATLMTENAFYPLFLCAALAIVLWLERPTPLRTAIVLGVSLVAYLTRQQAVALLPALLTAPLLRRGAGRASAATRSLYGLAAAGFVGILASSWREGARRSASSARTRWPAAPTTRSARWRSGSSTTSESSASRSA